MKEVEKRGTRLKIEKSGYNLAGFDHLKSEILSELKRVKFGDLKDMVYRLQITYNEMIDILDVKYVAGSTKGYTLPPSVNQIIDINLLLNSSLPKEVKVNITNDGVRLKSNLNVNRTIRFTKKSFFFTVFGFIESHS